MARTAAAVVGTAAVVVRTAAMVKATAVVRTAVELRMLAVIKASGGKKFRNGRALGLVGSCLRSDRVVGVAVRRTAPVIAFQATSMFNNIMVAKAKANQKIALEKWPAATTAIH